MLCLQCKAKHIGYDERRQYEQRAGSISRHE